MTRNASGEFPSLRRRGESSGRSHRSRPRSGNFRSVRLEVRSSGPDNDVRCPLLFQSGNSNRDVGIPIPLESDSSPHPRPTLITISSNSARNSARRTLGCFEVTDAHSLREVSRAAWLTDKANYGDHEPSFMRKRSHCRTRGVYNSKTLPGRAHSGEETATHRHDPGIP